MARNDTLSLVSGVWTQLTNANVTAVRVQNLVGYTIRLQATNGITEPDSTAGALELRPMATLATDLTLAQLWPGVTGANRLWALSTIGANVSVSHADG